MKVFKWTSVSLILMATVLFFCCKTDNKPAKEKPAPIDYNAMLEGNWGLATAYRDKEKVESLDNTRFKFDGQETMVTNFNATSEEKTNTYKIERNMIQQTGKASFTYLIKSVTDTTLTLITRYKGYNFELELIKWDPDLQIQ